MEAKYAGFSKEVACKLPENLVTTAITNKKSKNN